MTRTRIRTVSFVPPAGLAAWGWQAAREPLHLAGLGGAVALGLMTWPLLVLAIVFGLPACAAALVPRSWRAAHRHREAERGYGRPYIPIRLRRAVLAADRHRCLFCGSSLSLQLDHVMPWSCGGLSTLWNLVTLCGTCNRVKSNYWCYRRSGREVYRPFRNANNKAKARLILAVERRARCNPARWLRAAWALGN